jgi:hypothetical protein
MKYVVSSIWRSQQLDVLITTITDNDARRDLRLKKKQTSIFLEEIVITTFFQLQIKHRFNKEKEIWFKFSEAKQKKKRKMTENHTWWKNLCNKSA